MSLKVNRKELLEIVTDAQGVACRIFCRDRELNYIELGFSEHVGLDQAEQVDPRDGMVFRILPSHSFRGLVAIHKALGDAIEAAKNEGLDVYGAGADGTAGRRVHSD